MAINMKSAMIDRTMLFPCAAGVQMPQIGDEESKVKSLPGLRKSSQALPMKLVSQDTGPVDEKYVKMVSTGLSFAEEVVVDRCLDTLPYNTKYFEGVFEPGNLVPLQPRTHSAVGRHNKGGTDMRHMPCFLNKIIKPKQLTPLRKQAKEKALLLHRQALEEKKQEIRMSRFSNNVLEEVDSPSFFMTELADIKSSKTLKPSKDVKIDSTHNKVIKPKSDISVSVKDELKIPSVSIIKEKGSISVSNIEEKKVRKDADSQIIKEHDWDDHLMSRLSKLTANWIVHQRMGPSDKTKDKLSNILESWYGAPIHTDLVREEISDGEDDGGKKAKKPKSKWRKKEAALLERVYNVTPPPIEALDPYSDDSRAPFYRQPAGIRKKKKNAEKEEAALKAANLYAEDGEQRAINATAHSVEVKPRVETPPLTLRDSLKQGVGDKIFETNNGFQQEWLTGAKQLFDDDKDVITMDSKKTYSKSLQREMPQLPQEWYIKSDATQGHKSFKPHKGHKRWIGLPESIEENDGMLEAVPPGFDPIYMKEPDPKQKRKIKQNKILTSIVHDWRNKWFLNGQFADATPEDLIRDMADIQPHVRLKAVGTVAKAAEYKPPTDSSITLDHPVSDPINDLPEHVFVALECLLDDNNDQVQKAAAITLYSLDRPTEKAMLRLREMLHSDNAIDRWAGSQCLAHYGECDSDVVAEIIKQILDSESAIKHEQGMALLAKISNSSTLVHCMVAEQLNSSSWRYRVIACKILPTLFGTINRDITHKLSELMWHDWHVEVRKAAAQCLGKTSHGRDVHDDIRDRILNGTERTKMEAINKLGQLGIMTAKLLPAFLLCFSDSYVSIRCEVCITCGNLQIKDEQILKCLVHLATFDPIWKVKALAIQALGKIEEATDDIKECLLWAMRYEEKPGVRAEACHSLAAMKVEDEEFIETLQDRLLVESSDLVREEMIDALALLGLSTSEDMDTVAQIKSEVRKLCTRNIIASQIIVNENDEMKREQLKRKVCQTEKDIEALNEKKEVILRRIRSQARSVHEGSDSSSPPPQTSTPLPALKIGSSGSITTPEVVSREGTVFTPSVDKELEAILNQDEESETMSRSTSCKSRPLTEGSMKTEDEEEEWEEKQDVQDGEILDTDSQIVSKITVTKVDDTDNIEGTDNDEGMDAVTSRQADKSNQLRLPKSHSELMPSPVGGMASVDMRGSRLTVMSRVSGKRSIISRDSLREREKLNVEVNSIYADLNARYADMIQHLVNIDRGLNTKGPSAESSNVESLNVSNVGSSHISRLSHQEIIDTIKELEQIQSAREEKEGNNENGMKERVGENGDNIVDKVEFEETNNNQENNDGEWNSFVDTLSHDNSQDDNETTYPDYDDTHIGNSLISTDDNTAPLEDKTVPIDTDEKRYDNGSDKV